LNIVEDIAIRRAIPCGMLSLEMSAKQLQIRLLASMTRLNSWAIAGGLYKDKATMDRMHVALSEIGQAPMFIDETSSLKLSDMKAKVRRMVKVDGCKIVMVDYISLIDAEQPRIPRHEQIAEISRSTKALAKELDIPIIMLSQLTRDSEGKTPTLASLAETRSLEQDADVIMFLHRPRAGTEETGERPTVIPTDLIVAKNRNGPIGTAKLIFIPNITKFRDAEKNNMEESNGTH
jgi:replicative DNA helicase